MAALITRRGRGWWLPVANTAILLLVFVILAVTPAPVTFPGDHWEAALLVAGGILLLVGNALAAALGSAAAIERDRYAAAESRTMQHLRHYEHFEVCGDEGLIGIVDEVLPDRYGRPSALLIATGWFGTRRFLVPVDAIAAIDAERRLITVGGLRPPHLPPEQPSRA